MSYSRLAGDTSWWCYMKPGDMADAIENHDESTTAAVACWRCDGTGRAYDINTTCPVCDGEGVIEREEG